MRLLVCGGCNDPETVGMALHAVQAMRGRILALIHGATGTAGDLAAQWARANGVDTVSIPSGRQANSDLAAGRIFEEGRPDRVIAFPGADEFVRLAKVHRIPVWEPSPKTVKDYSASPVEA